MRKASIVHILLFLSIMAGGIWGCSDGGLTKDEDTGLITVSGSVTGVDDTIIILDGEANDTTTVNEDETFSFKLSRGGSYVIEPRHENYLFIPAHATMVHIDSDTTLQFSAKKDSGYINVTVAEAHWLYTEYAGQADFVALDVRSPSEYEDGHLPGAINMNVSAADFQEQLGALDKTHDFLVYCRSGGRSATAASIMISLGFGRVYNMLGGFSAWTTAEYASE